MKIEIQNLQEDMAIDVSHVEKVVNHILQFLEMKGDEISLRFVSNEEMCKLHKDYFNDPSPTDCITFPLEKDPSGYHNLGECVICPKAAIDFDSENRYKELTLYIVHTLLHIMGLSDIEEDEIAKMRAFEAKCMEELQSKGLLLS